MIAIGDLPSLTRDPLWPWSLSLGLPALGAVALVLVLLTVATYRTAKGASSRRVLVLVGLRLAALVVACLVVLRPSLSSREDLRLPSFLLILLDASESMTIQDEASGESRWKSMRRVLDDAEPRLQKLREEHNVTVVVYQFAEDLREYGPESKPDGKRTDFGQALKSLYERHGRDRNPRALLLFSDGADNGVRFPPQEWASRWRSLPCPLHTFGLGKATTAERQRDIAFTDIIPVPSPVPIKGQLTVKGILDAPGFENATVTVRLFIDDKEVLVQKETLRKTAGNEVKLVTDAPSQRPKDGEIKVTLKVDPLKGEVTETNNEISTFVTVTQEGISVLLVDQPRFPEPQRICDALSLDPRIRLYPAWLRTDDPSPEMANLFQFDKQHYDAIILGDVSPKRLSGGHPEVLTKIRDLVKDKGVGLMMMGGYESFGNTDWNNTPLADLMPVDLKEGGDVIEPIKMEPTPEGLGRYVMRLSDNMEENRERWKRLPELNGMNRLGTRKPTATVLAVRAGTRVPVLVSMDYGKGRVLAFAGDTTWRWERLGQPAKEEGEGVEAHHRFWKQVVLWLAHQDETEGNVWIKPDARRLAAGSKLGLTVGLRGKGGVDAAEAHFDVTVVDPRGLESPVPTAQEANGERGTFWKSDLPGEYRLVVRGRGKDTEGQPIPDSMATARFLVYQDEAELVRRAADHDFLAKLANSGGGKFHKAEELTAFLKELEQLPLPQARPKSESWPDWKHTSMSGFRVGIFLLFTGLLCLEWFFRRFWGMV